MAYVPGFEHDVFVSYAQVDNLPEPGFDQSCWVTNLVASLRVSLDQRLGRNGLTKIWMDERSLDGNASVTPEIQAAVSSSATLLIVLSSASMASQWCRQEWELFQQAAGSREKLVGRVFIVLPDELPLAIWPKPFQDRLGYKFYSRTEIGEIIRLGKPKPKVEQEEYHRQLEKLRRQLAEQLKKDPNPPPDPDKFVYLAEVSSDLEDARDQLAESLKNAKYGILPDRFYSRAPELYREEAELDLHKCALYVQMLGPRAARADNTQSYEGIQAELARAIIKDPDKMIYWRSPDTDPGKAKYADHRALLENPSLLVTGLEEFKQTVLTLLKRLGDTNFPPSEVNRLLLVNNVQEDHDLALQLLDDVEKQGLDYHVVEDEEKSVVDVAKALGEVHGLMVVFGKSRKETQENQKHEGWVTDQVLMMRSLVLEKKGAAPRCAVYISPPENRKLLCHFRQLVRIDSRQAFEQYLSAVAQRGQK